MPTYKVTTANLHLSRNQKEEIAKSITSIHNDTTGAPLFFAQVIFSTVESDDHFIGGKINSSPHIFVSGLIRDGRSPEIKQELMGKILRYVRLIADVHLEDIWVYIQDLPPTQMIEFGRFLPNPGEENSWKDGVSEKKRADFKSANVAF